MIKQKHDIMWHNNICIIYLYICIYIYIYILVLLYHNRIILYRGSCRPAARTQGPRSEGGMMRSETLVELNLLNSTSSSSNFSIRSFRAYSLVDIRQTVPCRAMRGKSSDSRQQYLSQQYHPPPLTRGTKHRRQNGTERQPGQRRTAREERQPSKTQKHNSGAENPTPTTSCNLVTEQMVPRGLSNKLVIPI